VVAAVNTSDEGFHSVLLFIESEKDLKKGLREHLKKQLPDYMIHKQITTLHPFPLTTNAKIDRKALTNTYLQNSKG